MPNIILTSRCQQKCPYCFARGRWSAKGETDMSVANFKIVLGFLVKCGEATIRLLGGEPTRHPEFTKIFRHIEKEKMNIHIFTNGLFPPPQLKFFLSRKNPIRFSVNINERNTYPLKSWALIRRNVKALAPRHTVIFGRVLTKPDFDLSELFVLAEQTGVKVIMLRPANPSFKRSGKNKKPIADSVIEWTEKAKEKGIRIGFGCGFSRDFFTASQIKKLIKLNVANLKWGCDANSGRYDIGPDLSVFRCFPLIKIRACLADFNDGKEVEDYFAKKIFTLIPNSAERHIQSGPCVANFLLRKALAFH
jgi:MoaA/NifB/PqqE/SkfB family radical SAM enzyme